MGSQVWHRLALVHGILYLTFRVDATDFLRKYPLPGRSIAETYDDNTHRNRNLAKRFLNAIRVLCGRTGEEDVFFDEEEREYESHLYDASESQLGRPFYWTSVLQDSFREELEK
jgi:phosphatidylinositol 4-kinase type 2